MGPHLPKHGVAFQPALPLVVRALPNDSRSEERQPLECGDKSCEALAKQDDLAALAGMGRLSNRGRDPKRRVRPGGARRRTPRGRAFFDAFGRPAAWPRVPGSGPREPKTAGGMISDPFPCGALFPLAGGMSCRPHRSRRPVSGPPWRIRGSMFPQAQSVSCGRLPPTLHMEHASKNSIWRHGTPRGQTRNHATGRAWWNQTNPATRPAD